MYPPLLFTCGYNAHGIDMIDLYTDFMVLNLDVLFFLKSFCVKGALIWAYCIKFDILDVYFAFLIKDKCIVTFSTSDFSKRVYIVFYGVSVMMVWH